MDMTNDQKKEVLEQIDPAKIYGSGEVSRLLMCSTQNIWLHVTCGRIQATQLDSGPYMITGQALIDFLHTTSNFRNTSKRRAIAGAA